MVRQKHRRQEDIETFQPGHWGSKSIKHWDHNLNYIFTHLTPACESPVYCTFLLRAALIDSGLNVRITFIVTDNSISPGWHRTIHCSPSNAISARCWALRNRSSYLAYIYTCIHNGCSLCGLLLVQSPSLKPLICVRILSISICGLRLLGQ